VRNFLLILQFHLFFERTTVQVAFDVLMHPYLWIYRTILVLASCSIIGESLLQSKLNDTHHKLHNARPHNKLRNFWHNSSQVAGCEWWRCGLIWIYYFFSTTHISLLPCVKLWEKLCNLLCF